MMEVPGGDEDIIAGHSTVDALRILHDELQEVIHDYQFEKDRKSFRKRWEKCFLYHGNRDSPFQWTSALIMVLLATFLLVAYGVQEHRDSWLVVEALVTLIIVALNCYYLGWEDLLRSNEMVNRASRVLKQVEACTRMNPWNAGNYINIHAPLSPCVTLQWTYRDGEIVNLPHAFLVEGDIILLRPGQVTPAHCRLFQMAVDEECCEMKEGDIYNPDLEHGVGMFSQPQARDPLRPRPFIMLETPFTKNLRDMLEKSERRPVSLLNNERHQVYVVWVERRIIPVVFLIMLITNVARYILLTDGVGHWAEMILVRQVQGILPLTALALPIIWKFLDVYGIAKVIVTFNKSKKQCRRKSSIEEFDSSECMDSKCHNDVHWTWMEVMRQFRIVLTGQADTLARTSNIVHCLGNVTSFCCVDKKGVLSWPNPTPEKVFFLRNDPGFHKHKSYYNESCPSLNEVNESLNSSIGDEELHTSGSQKNIRKVEQQTSKDTWEEFLPETHVEVLDLTPNPKNGCGVQFDDHSWKKYLSSLKPLGLNILLNTCHMSTVEQYTQFADHVTCASLKQEVAVPTVNRRCFCELASQMGFSAEALDIFDIQEKLGMYRHVPPESSNRERYGFSRANKTFIRYRMPMPNIFSVVAKESNSGMLQLMSQGTADLILDTCTDYWNGHDLCPLGEAERKKILDFYHRTSMGSYCTAFSYSPLTQTIGDKFSNMYIEVPEPYHDFNDNTHSPAAIHAWSDHTIHGFHKKPCYHGSIDSLIDGIDSQSIHDIEGCFKTQCNQIFIGLITMQYQAKQDIVQLIEDLEEACIRYVHFSKENELRSRVFSEKMGLEAGWNCHISLLSTPDSPSGKDLSRGRSQHSSDSIMRETASSTKIVKGTGDIKQLRRCSAPGNISLDINHVKFEAGVPIEEVSISSTRASSKHPSPQHDPNPSPADLYLENGDISDCSTPLMEKQNGSSPSKNPSPSKSKSNSNGEEIDDPLLDDSGHEDQEDMMIPQDEMDAHRSHRKESRLSEVENLSSSESYPASSHFTENTDSVTGGLGMSNRAKLPKGIENIRPHIDNVDNVPLLVSLFTDCTPSTTVEMLKIMQEYGEVVCVLGSSANIDNTKIFMEADCCLAVEPLYPQVCVKHPVMHQPWNEESPSPMELSMALHSLPCSLSFKREDHVSQINLIARARDHCQGVRNMFVLVLLLQLMVVLLQVFGCLLQLPPILATHHLLWLSTAAIPLLSLTMVANPLDTSIMSYALGKNKNHLVKQSVKEFVLYFCVTFVPSIIVCLSCFTVTLATFCNHVTARTNSTCHFIMSSSGESDPSCYSGWITDYHSGLVIAQNVTAYQLLVYDVCVSLCYIHRLHHLWQKTPLVNRLWCFTVPFLLVLQTLYFVIDILRDHPADVVGLSLHDVPPTTWVIACVWPFVLIPILELIKRREIKLSVRAQKRARLDFGTKLGMNSPF